jgi:hypothetical protein
VEALLNPMASKTGSFILEYYTDGNKQTVTGNGFQDLQGAMSQSCQGSFRILGIDIKLNLKRFSLECMRAKSVPPSKLFYFPYQEVDDVVFDPMRMIQTNFREELERERLLPFLGINAEFHGLDEEIAAATKLAKICGLL